MKRLAVAIFWFALGCSERDAMQPVPSVDAAVDPVQAAPPSSSQNIAGHVEPPPGAAKPGRAASSDVPPAPPGFVLTWKDDFNGAAGKPVEPGKWIYDTGTGYGCAGCPSQWGTFEIETMTSSTRNVSLDGDGNLLITPVRDADGTWTSGRIETRKTNFSAGDHGILRVQAAIQLPA